MIPPAANASSTKLPTAERALTEEVMRPARPEQQCTADTAWHALELLAVLHNGLRDHDAEVLRELQEFEGGAFRSVVTEIRFLEERMDAPFEQALAQLIEERVVRRHLWIALRKLRYQGDYTFLIETDNGRIRLRDKDGPVYTNPRLGPAITFLKDIHLLSASGLTPLGESRAGLA